MMVVPVRSTSALFVYVSVCLFAAVVLGLSTAISYHGASSTWGICFALISLGVGLLSLAISFYLFCYQSNKFVLAGLVCLGLQISTFGALDHPYLTQERALYKKPPQLLHYTDEPIFTEQGRAIGIRIDVTLLFPEERFFFIPLSTYAGGLLKDQLHGRINILRNKQGMRPYSVTHDGKPVSLSWAFYPSYLSFTMGRCIHRLHSYPVEQARALTQDSLQRFDFEVRGVLHTTNPYNLHDFYQAILAEHYPDC